MAPRMTRRSTLLGLAGGLATIATGRAEAPAPATASSNAILISNVRIFDGIEGQLRPGNLLVEDRRIKRISSNPIAAPPDGDAMDGGGRVLMPGLTDAHWHMIMAPNRQANLEQADPGLMYANAVAEAERTLLRGFTTVRDTAARRSGSKRRSTPA